MFNYKPLSVYVSISISSILIHTFTSLQPLFNTYNTYPIGMINISKSNIKTPEKVSIFDKKAKISNKDLEE